MIFRVFACNRRGMRLVTFLIAAFAASFARIAAAPTVAEDLIPQLRDVLQGAMAQSPAMIQRNLLRVEADQLTLVSSAALYPRLSSSFVYNAAQENQTEDDPDRGWNPTNRYNAFLTLSYPLLHWGENGAAADIGRIQAKIAANQVRDAYRDLALQIRAAYLQLIIDKAALRSARLGEELTRRRLTVVQARIASGELGPSADSGARLEMSETVLAVEGRAVAFERSLRTFRHQVGNPGFTVEMIPDAIPDVPRLPRSEVALGAEEFSNKGGLAKDGRHENLSFEVRKQELQLAIARVAQRPKLDLTTGLSQDQLSFVSDVGQRTGVQSLYAGISASWNIFDGRATRGRILAARTRLQVLQNQLADLQEDLRYAAEQRGTDLDFAARALKHTEDRHGGSTAGFNLTRENFELKRASQDDLDSAQLALNSAELNLFSARATYLNALAAWLYSINADPAVPATILSRPSR